MNDTTHFGYQEVSIKDKGKLVGNVFHSVANKYDIMNDVMSFGLHRLWKDFTVHTSQIRPGDKVLDIAGGTADMSLRLKRLVGDSGCVWHTDINSSMLKIGRDKLIDNGVILQSCLCDAQNLPFPNGYFDAVCIAFGLRNITKKEDALIEMKRVLKPGGIALILEFSRVQNPLLSKIYDLYSFQLLPKIGKYIANDEDSYRYLAESIRMHPGQDQLKQMMHDSGFTDVSYSNLAFGVVALHKGYVIA